MIYYSNYDPNIFPFNSSVGQQQLDRVQDISGSITLNREKIKEVGRDGLVGWRERTPSNRVSLRQLEYGSLQIFRRFANVADSVTTLDLADFKTTQFDIASYLTDDSGTFFGTLWYPNLRLAGFGVSIGDPDAQIERSFELVNEDEILWQNDNKYLIYLQSTGGAPATHHIVIGSGGFATYPDPVENPDDSGNYLLRVIRVRAGVATELTLTTDYTYNSGTTTITISGNQASDVYKIWYTATTYISGSSPFTDNDSDPTVISADSCDIYMQVSSYVYKVQSISFDVTFDRFDIKEVGNKNVVTRGSRANTVRLTLGRILEAATIEEILRGVAGSSFGRIDAREFRDDISLSIKIYSDNTKATFLMGYKMTNLSPVSLDAGASIDQYTNRTVTLECEELTISSSESEIDS